MSDPLLNVMKIMLLAGLYLFFVRVLWVVYSDLRDSQNRLQSAGAGSPAGPASASSHRSPQPASAASATPVVPADSGSRRSRRNSADDARLAPVRTSGGGRGVTVGQLVAVAPPELAGASYALGNELVIGRHPQCGIALQDGYVSQQHARIFLRDSQFFVEDLQSRNGTLLNGKPLRATTKLRSGDQLGFGATIVEFS